MKLAAVMVNYYSMGKTMLACQSLLNNSRPPDEIFVIDNGSTVTERQELALSLASPAVTLVRPRKNLGYGAAVNLGVREALKGHCSAILVLNNDVELEASCIERLMDGWRPSEEIRSPVVRHTGPTGDLETWWAGGRISALLGRAVHDRSSQAALGGRPAVTKTGFVSGCSLLVGDCVWDSLGGFSEDYFLYWEDVELSYRARKSGISLLCVNGAYISHDVGASSGSRARHGSPTASYYGSRNRWLFLRRVDWARAALAVNLLLTIPRLARLFLQTAPRDGLARACFKAAVKGTVAGVRGDFSLAVPL